MLRNTACLTAIAILPACANPPKEGPYRPQREVIDQQARALLAKAERLWRAEDPELETARKEILQSPATTGRWVRLMVVYAHGSRMKYLRAQRDIVQTVRDREARGYQKAVEELQRLGPVAIPAIVSELLRDTKKLNRDTGIDLVAQMGPSVLPALEPTLTDGSQDRLRRAAVTAVGGMKSDDTTTAVLLRATRDGDYGVRGAAYEGLSKAGRVHLPLLRKAVSEEADPFVRRKIIESLAGFPDRKTAAVVVDFYRQALKTKDRTGVRTAERVLWKMSGTRRRLSVDAWKQWVMNLPEGKG